MKVLENVMLCHNFAQNELAAVSCYWMVALYFTMFITTNFS